MGMDVYGKNEGAYFRRSVWGWRPLADYVLSEHADLAAGCAYWHSNDGDGLDEAGALALAAALRADVESGAAAAYITARDARIAALPQQPCNICQGRGTRTREDDERLLGAGAAIAPEGGMKCNGCNGVGYVADWETHYPLDVDDLRDFARFLETSGGFAIH